MTNASPNPRVTTGVVHLDAVLGGGLPQGTTTVLAGSPGAGKTTLAQQICFHHVGKGRKVLYFSTLSQSAAKMLFFLRGFDFFDPVKLASGITFTDLGIIAREKGLERASALIMEYVQRERPSLVVIDSFKAFDDLSASDEDRRKFGYSLAVLLTAWECTTLLLGEYAPVEYQTNPLFSIVDGLIAMTQREVAGEHQRYLQVVKMRGTQHSRDVHPFVITSAGIEVFAPRITVRRSRESVSPTLPRCQTGVSRLDELLGNGIPRGSSLLVAGGAGTGKTLLLLDFIYRGALAGERGLFFSFEETEDRLRTTARTLGWDLEREIASGMVEIVFIPQPDISVDANLLMIDARVRSKGIRRVAIDSVSVFLHKITDATDCRERIFELATIVQNSQAVGFFASDVPFGAREVSPFGAAETIVDGVILLTAVEDGMERRRYLEVYKLRNTAHLKGRHSMQVGPSGIVVYPRYHTQMHASVPPLDSDRRLPSGIPGLDPLLGGGLLPRSVTLISGSAGIGKTTLGIQFVLAGAALGQPGLYLALEESPDQIMASARGMGLPLADAVAAGSVEVVFLPREAIRSAQLLTVLTDLIARQKTERIVLDSATHIEAEGLEPDGLRRLLYVLAGTFKSLGVTSLVTFEAPMFATDIVVEHGVSPIADNLVLMRYSPGTAGLRRALTVVKSRGSAHDLGTYTFTVGKNGLQVGPLLVADHPAATDA